MIAQPGSFKVEVVGIATFTTTNPGAALVFLDPAVAPAEAARPRRASPPASRWTRRRA